MIPFKKSTCVALALFSALSSSLAQYAGSAPPMKGMYHSENLPMQYYREMFSVIKLEKNYVEMFWYFYMFVQNIECGYTLEPPVQSMFWIKNRKK